jgi:hypothetical protein
MPPAAFDGRRGAALSLDDSFFLQLAAQGQPEAFGRSNSVNANFDSCVVNGIQVRGKIAARLARVEVSHCKVRQRPFLPLNNLFEFAALHFRHPCFT